MEIDTGIAAIVTAGALVSKDTINKLLGPTADYLGELLQGKVQKRAENIGRIFQKAAKKLGSKIDEPGQVHPKLLKGLIMDGSFCDDELTAEYYGGVLASSRTGVSRDDRGTTYLNQISNFSIYQIRTHFILYMVLRRLFCNSQLTPSLTDIHYEMKIFISESDYHRAMAFDENNENDTDSLINHSLRGLECNGLIINVCFGDRHFMDKQNLGLNFPESGFVFAPTLSGIGFFLWATGHGHLHFDSFLTDEITIEVPKDITMPSNAFSLKDKHKGQHNKSQQSKP